MFWSDVKIVEEESRSAGRIKNRNIASQAPVF